MGAIYSVLRRDVGELVISYARSRDECDHNGSYWLVGHRCNDQPDEFQTHQDIEDLAMRIEKRVRRMLSKQVQFSDADIHDILVGWWDDLERGMLASDPEKLSDDMMNFVEQVDVPDRATLPPKLEEIIRQIEIAMNWIEAGNPEMNQWHVEDALSRAFDTLEKM